MEWNGITLLGLSPSLLGGGAPKDPKMDHIGAPWSGADTSVHHEDGQGHLPFTGGSAIPAF